MSPFPPPIFYFLQRVEKIRKEPFSFLIELFFFFECVVFLVVFFRVLKEKADFGVAHEKP